MSQGLIKLNQAYSSEEAIRQAKLNWIVEQSPMMTTDGIHIEGHKALYRGDNRAVLGVVGARYQPLQNYQAFAFFDTVAAQMGISYEFAGSIKGGKRIFLQAKLGRGFTLKNGDRVEAYLTLTSTHDGSGTVHAFVTPIRLWCMNQLNRSWDEVHTRLSIRHTNGMHEKLLDGQALFGEALADFAGFQKRAQILAEKIVNQTMVDKFLETVFEPSESTRSENQKRKVVELFQSGLGNHGRTAWELYNGLVEYVQNERGSDPEKRLASGLFGSGAELKEKAFQAALAL